MAKPSLVVVLVEDLRQRRFVYRFLQRLNYSAHDIRLLPLPSGRGSGAQWVLDQYVAQVQAYRNRSARATSALLIAIDADNQTVMQRQKQLENLAARVIEDRIAHLIPKWSIETWILCLSGKLVDESQSYRGAPNIDEKIPPAAATFFEWSRPNAALPPHCVPSLQAAIPEVLRL